MIRGVIFDLDGVLLATDEAHYQAWKQVAEAQGIPFDRTTNERLKGVGRMDSLNIILERASRTYTDSEKEALAERKNAIYRAALTKLTPQNLLPGARRLLDDLRRRGIKLAIASSSKNAALIVERLELAFFFETVVDGNQITHSKPHPEVFQRAAERLGLAAHECLVIEDAPAGIEAARRAGMAVFGIGAHETLVNAIRRASGLDQITAEDLLQIA